MAKQKRKKKTIKIPATQHHLPLRESMVLVTVMAVAAYVVYLVVGAS